MRPHPEHATRACDPSPDSDELDTDGGGCITLGVPVVLEAAAQTFSTGLGLQLFGNLNRTGSYAGAAVFVQLGWMP